MLVNFKKILHLHFESIRIFFQRNLGTIFQILDKNVQSTHLIKKDFSYAKINLCVYTLLSIHSNIDDHDLKHN